MKKYITLFLILLSGASLSAQIKLERAVVGSLGYSFEESTLQISATVGEAVVTSISNSELLLTQGFHQAEPEEITSVQIISGILVNFSVYPNPATNNFWIKVLSKNRQSLRFEVIDVSGRRLKAITQELAANTESSVNINISNWSPGIYFVRLLQEDGLLVGSARLFVVTSE